MTRPAALTLVALALIVAGCSSLTAADAPSPESQAAAKKVLGDWYAGFTAAKTLSTEFHCEVAVKQGGQVVQSDSTDYRFALERPQRLALVVTKGEGVSVINDGKQFYEYAAALGKYQLADAAPATYADLLQSKVLRFANFGQGLGILGEALKSADAAAFLATFTSPQLVGVEEVDGAKAQHVRLVQEAMPVDLWFSADSSRLVKFVPDLAAGLAAKGNVLPPGVELTLSVSFKNWTYDAPLPADALKISPPSDAELVDDLFAQPPHKLLGQQAPAFDTTDLDGHPLKSASLAGKVVMLDFWATWCGPCVQALPKVGETATKYKDKGVVFYAVNQGEEASIIKEFLAAQKLSVPVAMDVDGKLGAAYGVEGIPQTVIIDKNGKVQVVHVGAGPDIGNELVKDLDAVLAGKDLAAEKLKKKSGDK